MRYATLRSIPFSASHGLEAEQLTDCWVATHGAQPVLTLHLSPIANGASHQTVTECLAIPRPIPLGLGATLPSVGHCPRCAATPWISFPLCLAALAVDCGADRSTSGPYAQRPALGQHWWPRGPHTPSPLTKPLKFFVCACNQGITSHAIRPHFPFLCGQQDGPS